MPKSRRTSPGQVEALWPERLHHRRGPNLRAAGAVIAAMGERGQLEPVDAATIAGLRTSAGLLDAALADAGESRFTLARLLSEHGAWVDRCRALAGGASDELDRLLRELSAPVGDSPDP